MNQYITYAFTVVVTAAAMVAYQYEGKPGQVGLAQQAHSQVPIRVPEIKNDTVQVEQVIRQEGASARISIQDSLSGQEAVAQVDWDALEIRLGGSFVNMILRLPFDEFSDLEVAAFNELHVIPFNREADKVCSDELSEHTVGGTYQLCHSIYENPPHPYESMSFEELATLAEADALAAAYASRKAEKFEDQFGMAIGAAALSGKSGPLLDFAHRSINTGVELVNGRATQTPRALVAHLIVKDIAQKMGDPRVKPDAWKEYIASLEIPQNQKEAYETSIAEGIQSVLQGMAEVQREVTGSTQVRELLDA